MLKVVAMILGWGFIAVVVAFCFGVCAVLLKEIFAPDPADEPDQE